MYVRKEYQLNETITIEKGKNTENIGIKINRTRHKKKIHVNVTVEGSAGDSEEIAREIKMALQRMKRHKEISHVIIALDYRE